MEKINLFDDLMEVVELARDEEIIANSLKVIRFIFKEQKYMFYVSSQSPEVINKVISLLVAHGQNQFIRREVFMITSVYCSLSTGRVSQHYELHRDITDESI